MKKTCSPWLIACIKAQNLQRSSESRLLPSHAHTWRISHNNQGPKSTVDPMYTQLAWKTVFWWDLGVHILHICANAQSMQWKLCNLGIHLHNVFGTQSSIICRHSVHAWLAICSSVVQRRIFRRLLKLPQFVITLRLRPYVCQVLLGGE